MNDHKGMRKVFCRCSPAKEGPLLPITLYSATAHHHASCCNPVTMLYTQIMCMQAQPAPRHSSLNHDQKPAMHTHLPTLAAATQRSAFGHRGGQNQLSAYPPECPCALSAASSMLLAARFPVSGCCMRFSCALLRTYAPCRTCRTLGSLARL